MIRKQIQIIGQKTMADFTPRITIDLLDGNSEDVKSVHELMTQPNEGITMILCKTENLVDTIIQIAKEINPEE